ncbi:MAG: hypothetical protein QMC11_09460 [Rhodospirillales bacterium]
MEEDLKCGACIRTTPIYDRARSCIVHDDACRLNMLTGQIWPRLWPSGLVVPGWSCWYWRML